MNTITVAKKTTQGRQKIEIKKIEKVSNRQVTFSKRRGGLFKKASELCILSGAEVAIIVKSPGKRTFAFGHPNANAIIDRYLTGISGGGGRGSSSPPPRGGGSGGGIGGGSKGRTVKEFNERYAEAAKELEAEKRRRVVIDESKKVATSGGFWWEEAVDGLGLEELEQYVAALEELKKNVAMRAEELVLMKASSLASAMFALNHQSAMVNPGGGGVGGVGLLTDRFIIKQGNDCISRSNTVTPMAGPLGFDFGRGCL